MSAMRLWVSHEHRRPQPEPLATNDRLAYLVGIALWLAALAAVGVLAATGVVLDAVTVIATIAIGLVLGVAGIIVAARSKG